jgi:hypothetical protein
MLSPLCVSLRRPGEPVEIASPARQPDSNDNPRRRCRDILLLADLPPWQIKFLHWAAANQPDGQITSDFQKWCQAPFAKIFRFAPDPNQLHMKTVLSHREGRIAIVTDVGNGMRWT